MKRLPPLPTIADLIRLYGLSAKSQLSQNFLLDLNITDKLVRSAGNLTGCVVCEVGPGPGALTRSILNAGPATVIAIEKDRRFQPSLELLSEASGACDKHVSRKTWEEDPPDLHILGNLPFNVSIPLLLQWLSLIPKRQGPFLFGRTQLTLTFQKEVADRIMAVPDHPQRSRLSIMAQHLCDIKLCFNMPGAVFVPRPKVDATVLKFTPRVVPKIDVEYNVLETVVKTVFQYRRKFIRRGASLLFPGQPDRVVELFRLSGVDETLRPQQLTLENFRDLTFGYRKILGNLSSET
ncbi:hypothetical protein EMCRGX_G034910 [Ephydatia muelleri]